MDEVLRTVREGVPGDGRTFSGRGARPNLTFVNLPGVDSSGHGTGRGSGYDATVGAADDQIERFVAQQKQLGLWDRSVVVLLSDHSMETSTQRSSLTARFTAAGISVERLRGRAERLGGVRLRHRPPRARALRAAQAAAGRRARLVGAPAGRAARGRGAGTATRTRRTAGARTRSRRATRPGGSPRASAPATSSSRPWPGGAFNEPNPLTGNHGGPLTRDNFFAVIGGGPLVRRQAIASAQDPRFDDTERNPGQAENVDVAPTVTRLLGAAAPAQSQGRFLAEAFDAVAAADRRAGRRRAGACAALGGLPLGRACARAGAGCASASAAAARGR